MKSSTIRRSTLSRETMEVIENLAKEHDNSIPEEYVRPQETVAEASEDSLASKAQEIDLLWQTFKSTQFTTNSPTAYILMGVVIGIVSTLIVLFCIGAYVKHSDLSPSVKGKMFGLESIFNHKKSGAKTLEQQAQSATEELNNKVVVPSEDDVTAPVPEEAASSEPTEGNTGLDTSKMKKYIVKSGDTGESIIKHYFGTYSPEKAELIRKVNNLQSIDRINIGQELLIPVQE